MSKSRRDSAGRWCSTYEACATTARGHFYFAKALSSSNGKDKIGVKWIRNAKKVYLSLLKNVDADAFIIHARHAQESSREPPHWDIFEECIATGKRIIPNGDMSERGHISYFKDRGIKEVMIGRAALRDPSVFNFLNGKEKEPRSLLRSEYLALCEEFPNNTKYKQNVLTYMGKEIHNKKWFM